MTRTTVSVAVAFALLVALTTTLASFYHAERTARAASHFDRGQQHRANGDLAAAAVELRAALSLARGRTDYQLALGLTLLEAGHTREAVSYLDDVLRVDPTSGIANRARAEASRALREPGEAAAYYRRAIYGVWPPDAAADRQATRLTFVEFLLASGQRAEALGELGSLAADVPVDSPVRARVAALLLAASATEQAAEVLRATVAVAPDDAQAWRRLSEAEFALGAYRAAAAAAKRALALGPGDPATASRLETAEAVLAIDPTIPRLPASERQRRSRHVLELAMASLDACLSSQPSAEPPEIAELRRVAAGQLEARTGRDDAATDARLGVADVTWRQARSLCPAVPPGETALGLVMRRLAGEGAGS